MKSTRRLSKRRRSSRRWAKWQTGSGPGSANRFPRDEKEPSLHAEVTTPSLEAWRSYSAAMKAAETRSLGTETRSLLRRAIEIDPKFAMAYAQLGLSDIETAAAECRKGL